MKPKEWDKTSKNYYEEILSPIKNSASSPLLKDIKKIKNKSEVIDLGTGPGDLLPVLAKQFKHVTAIDFSKKMLEKAKTKAPFPNVTYKQINLTNLSSLKTKFNAAIAINSIIDPNKKTISKILKQIHKILKPKGTFIAIFPSIEVYTHQAFLISKHNPKKLKEFTNKKEINFSTGITNFNGKQKAFYKEEIIQLLEKAGFKNIKIKKVLYLWIEFKKAGQAYFPKEKLPWDWYVICNK